MSKNCNDNHGLLQHFFFFFTNWYQSDCFPMGSDNSSNFIIFMAFLQVSLMPS